MTERWVKFNAELASEVVFVLDASESAAGSWAEISRVTGELLNSLPLGSHERLFFLGNPVPYSTRHFEAEVGCWYQANQCRASLIGSVFRQLEGEPDTRVVVLGSGRIFDLADWESSPLLEHVLFVRCGHQPLTGQPGCEHQPVVQSLQRQLDNPSVRVEISAGDAMPFYWDNPAYQWDGARLVAQKTDDWAVHIGFLSGSGAKPQARAIRRDGDGQTLSLQDTDPAWSPNEWHALTQAETDLFRQARRGRYQCPICPRAHTADTLRCEEGRLLGTPIYPTLANQQGFILLREDDSGVVFCRLKCPALALGGGAIAIQSGGAATVYQFDPATGTWAKGRGPFQPYGLVKSSDNQESYAIVL